MCKTINHAELAGIWLALQAIPDTTPILLGTDSLSSLHQINNYLLSPQAYTNHIHAPLLALIAKAITTRSLLGTPTHLGKVPAHKGIAGNEIADQLAKSISSQATTPTHTMEVPEGPATTLLRPCLVEH